MQRELSGDQVASWSVIASNGNGCGKWGIFELVQIALDSTSINALTMA